MLDSRIISTTFKYLPLGLNCKIMNMFVRHSYNTNHYNEIYRERSNLTKFENIAFSKFFSYLHKSEPCILDIGCGAGKPYDIFLQQKNCQLTGVDCSKKQIERAQKNVPNAKYIVVDFMKYKASPKYDGIIMLYSLFHIKREYHEDILRKSYEMLDQGGKMLITVRREDSGNIKYRSNFCGQPMLWSHYSYKAFKRILRSVGFSFDVIGDEKSYGSSESHLWLLLEKR